MKATKIGNALRLLSLMAYTLSDALGTLGDILGDAGESYDASSPAIHAKAKAAKANVADVAWTTASIISGAIACCLTVGYKGMHCTIRGVIAVMAAGVALADQIREAGWTTASFLYRNIQRMGQAMAGAWSFREELLSEGRA